jgi:hypothetical protein
MQRLALGTVQFGLPYGVANQQGQVSLYQAAAILTCAQGAGLDTLDTAMAYGNSEERLGQVGVPNWKVISKLPALPDQALSVEHWVEEAVATCLDRLRVGSLYGLLLHRSADLLGSQGTILYKSLVGLKQRGWVEKIGVSVYGPEELAILYPRFPLDLVQAPFNGLDQRLVTSGWLSLLQQNGVEVHGRSLFLQGLLLMPPEHRPPRFRHWQPLWDAWDSWLAETRVSPLQACLGCAWHQTGLSRLVVGVDSLTQLQEILTALGSSLPPWPDHLRSDDIDLINPARWTLL